MNARVLVHGLQGGSPGDREGGRVLEGQAGWLVREPVVGDERVPGEGSAAEAEHLVADGEVGHRGPEGDHCSRDVGPQHRVLGPTRTEDQTARLR